MCTVVDPGHGIVENKYRSAAGKLSRNITIQLTSVYTDCEYSPEAGGLMSAEGNRGRKRMRKKPEKTEVQIQKTQNFQWQKDEYLLKETQNHKRSCEPVKCQITTH